MDIKRLLELSGVPEAISPGQAKLAHDHDSAHEENLVREYVAQAEAIIDDMLANPRPYAAHVSKPRLYVWTVQFSYQPGMYGSKLIIKLNKQDKVLGELDNVESFQEFITMLVDRYKQQGWYCVAEQDGHSSVTTYTVKIMQ